MSALSASRFGCSAVAARALDDHDVRSGGRGGVAADERLEQLGVAAGSKQRLGRVEEHGLPRHDGGTTAHELGGAFRRGVVARLADRLDEADAQPLALEHPDEPEAHGGETHAGAGGNHVESMR